MHICIGSDHRGYVLKEQLKVYLTKKGKAVDDVGEYSRRSVDYPRIAARLVRRMRKRQGVGILICGSGVGTEIAANKFTGVRAANLWNTRVAKSARIDDDVNVLCLGADYLSYTDARRIVDTWLATPRGTAKRYLRRIRMLSRLGP